MYILHHQPEAVPRPNLSAIPADSQESKGFTYRCPEKDGHGYRCKAIGSKKQVADHLVDTHNFSKENVYTLPWNKWMVV